MVLTPQLRQRIEMLQMTALELKELIDVEMATNPLLEEVQPGDEIEEISSNILDQNSDSSEVDTFAAVGDADGGGGAEDELRAPSDLMAAVGGDSGRQPDADAEPGEDGHAESSDPFDEIDYGREFQDYLDPGYRTQEIEYKDDAPSFEQFLTHAPSLSEHLEWQLSMLSLSPITERAALAVIGNLDADGRLGCSIEEIAASSSCTVEQAEAARQEVLFLDPVGCGAFSAVECLLAQLKADDEDDTLAAELVAHHLEDCQPHRLQHLAKSTGADLETLRSEIARIRELDPFPGRRYSSEGTMYVRPRSISKRSKASTLSSLLMTAARGCASLRRITVWPSKPIQAKRRVILSEKRIDRPSISCGISSIAAKRSSRSSNRSSRVRRTSSTMARTFLSR
ncbi:MAG: RNA polymerase sigma-54 factor [Acidobacteria bacterium OLB17]|nr:MAG: RNA polymerase sigma-54 factor [Acidobacteria bacterium OLB17]